LEGRPWRRKRAAGAQACTFLDYDRDGFLDLFVCNFVKLDPDKPLSTNDMSFCQWKGVPTMCGPRGLPGDTDILYHNNGDGTFTDVSEKAGILKPGPRYSISATSYDFDNDGWPDIYVAVDSEPSMMFKNNHDGTFTDVAVIAGCAYNEDGHEQAGMGLGVADYDCDGWLDIFKTNFADDTSDLYHNNRRWNLQRSVVQFRRRESTTVMWRGAAASSTTTTTAGRTLFQVNGHVYPEIDNYNFGESFKNPRLVYKNLGNGRFKDVSAEMGPGISGAFLQPRCGIW